MEVLEARIPQSDRIAFAKESLSIPGDKLPSKIRCTWPAIGKSDNPRRKVIFSIPEHFTCFIDIVKVAVRVCIRRYLIFDLKVGNIAEESNCLRL